MNILIQDLKSYPDRIKVYYKKIICIVSVVSKKVANMHIHIRAKVICPAKIPYKDKMFRNYWCVTIYYKLLKNFR